MDGALSTMHLPLWGLDWPPLLAVALVVVVWILRKPLARALVWITLKIARVLGIEIDANLQVRIVPAIAIMIVCLALLIVLDLTTGVSAFRSTLENLLLSVVIGSVFSVWSTLAVAFVAIVHPEIASDPAPDENWLLRLVRFVILVLAVAALLKLWGIDIGPTLTGVGVLGAGIALAAQDVVRNMMAGFGNVSERRFQIGDWIAVEGVIEGTVERVNLRSTRIRRFDAARVFVPNAALAAANVVNYSRMPHRRILWTLPLHRDSTEAQIRQIRDAVEDLIEQSEDLVSTAMFPHYARVLGLGDSSIDLMVQCFTRSREYDEFLRIQETVFLQIKAVVQEAGTAFAVHSFGAVAGPECAS